MPRFQALPTDVVRALQTGGPDAHGHVPERKISDGAGTPCRHCLRDVPAGAEMLVLAFRPFPKLQPYAEAGPIFLCADPCERHEDDGAVPPVLQSAPDYLLKGYSAEDRIVYGTGRIVASEAMRDYAAEVLTREDVAYVHVRSARNNCYQARIDRG
ncbi:DUF1203 domain-containing protein [Chachezhania sediminis]|uniref:DUF1203 domain-containing protein n=1 Tax=Chachezhania sediminis TaxID=2599291 RepID=UPI00131B29D8|nr:DUF1203 domain-containing protein [Chachezhania sediminis]